MQKLLYGCLILCCAVMLSVAAAIWYLTPHTYKVPVDMRPLPGGLDRELVFNSNSPEVVLREGILLSTLPPAGTAQLPVCLDFPFYGAFTVFSHHIANDAGFRPRVLHLGLLASNLAPILVNLRLVQGASFLSIPDAPFGDLPPATSDPAGQVYGGPGDRVATEFLHGRSPLPPSSILLPPGGTRLIASWPVPTDGLALPINGRSMLLRFTADGPVYLSEVAALAARGAAEPDEAEYVRLLAAMDLSGPHELASRLPAAATGRFYYGRVAGVSQGGCWWGQAPELRPGGLPVGFPLATSYRKDLGTGQVQSATLARRYPDTAAEAHANYGVVYELHLPLTNDGPGDATFMLRLSDPLRAEGRGADAQMVYQHPPQRAVAFRGPLRLAWRDDFGRLEERFVHVVLHHGEQGPPFASITAPAGGRFDVTLTTIYPADATPPQLLTVERP